jgi:hypothetical protein
MEIISGLLVATFLILVAASAAVVGSLIVLGLFDLAFVGKRALSASVESTEDEPLELSEPTSHLTTDAGAPENDNIVPFRRTA